MNVAPKIKEIADKADLIVNGYAYTRDKGYINVTNLNNLSHTAVIYNDKIVETNMDEIEAQIVLDYYVQDKEFLGSSET